MVGLALPGIAASQSFYSQRGSWLLYCNYGSLYNNGDGSKPYVSADRVTIKAGDVISVLYDNASRMLAFECNDVPLGVACSLPADQKNSDLMPAVDYIPISQSATFL